MKRKSRQHKQQDTQVVPTKTILRTIDEIEGRPPHKTFFSALFKGGVWVSTTLIISAIVDYCINEHLWLIFSLVCVVALFAATSYFTVKNSKSTQVWRAIARLAKQHLDGYETIIQENKTLQQRVATHEHELQKLEGAFAHADEAIKQFTQGFMHHQLIDSLKLKRSLVLCLRFFSALAQKSPECQLRCGLIMKKHSDPTTLIPLAVYSPTRTNYGSASEFSADKDFSGRFLAYFSQHVDSHNLSEHVYYHIPNTPVYLRRTKDPWFNPHGARQRNEIISLLGNIIYRNDGGKIQPQGVLNIDGSKAHAIDIDFLQKHRSFQRPVYRILNALLQLAENDSNLYKQLSQQLPHGKEEHERMH